MKKVRLGLVVGFAAGYYFGTKAGRERYEQLRRVIDRIRPVAKLHAAAELGRERLRVARESHSEPALDAVVPPSSN